MNLLDFFHENNIDCKHCLASCTQKGKDENTLGIYLDSIWYNGFQCNNHSGFEPRADLLVVLCKYKDQRIKELETENAKLKAAIER